MFNVYSISEADDDAVGSLLSAPSLRTVATDLDYMAARRMCKDHNNANRQARTRNDMRHQPGRACYGEPDEITDEAVYFYHTA